MGEPLGFASLNLLYMGVCPLQPKMLHWYVALDGHDNKASYFFVFFFLFSLMSLSRLFHS